MREILTRIVKRASGHDGFIIVAVLWILAALATLASIISVYVINTAVAFTVHDERLQAETLARAAIELAVYRVNTTSTQTQAPPSRGAFAFRMGNASVATDFISESARVDLNTAPKELLSGLFAAFGSAKNAADAYADQIIAWRSAPPQGAPDPAGYYRAAGLVYSPRAAPFQHIAELGLVMGIPEPVVERVMPYVTVYSGTPQINVLDAAPQVVAALPGMDPERLNRVLALRRTGPQNTQGLLAMLGSAQTFATAQGNKAMRVTARIAFDSGQRMTTEAVIFVLDSGTEPYRVLTWRDDADDGRTQTR
jgi:general secretion pathway protein K